MTLVIQQLSEFTAYWSPRLARSHYCQQLNLSVCPDVCLSQKIKIDKLILLFCFSMESSHFFGRQFSMIPSTKR